MPRVSVVVPTFNRGGLLVEAVRSALGQTFTDLEVIVADDGSTDGSIEQVENLGDDRVQVLRLEHRGLLGAVRNTALGHASGDFIAFLDSDDLWFPQKLERQVAVLNRDLDVGLVCSNARLVDEEGHHLRLLYLPEHAGASGHVLAELLADNFVIVSSAVARRSLIGRVGRFTEDAQLRGVEDYDLWLRLASVSAVTYLPEPLVAYREHKGSMRRGVKRSTYWKSLLAATDNLVQALATPDSGLQKAVRKRRARLYMDLAVAQLEERSPAAAVRSLATAATLTLRRQLPDPARATN